MRKAQFLHSYVGGQPRPTRTSPSIYEFCFALRNWRRQIRLHFCYLQWMQRSGAKVLADAATGPKAAEPQGNLYVAGEGASPAIKHQTLVLFVQVTGLPGLRLPEVQGPYGHVRHL